MCGLAAIFGYNYPAPPVDEDELLAIREQMKQRGPDGKGLWISSNQRVGLAHRRLAIIDPHPEADQPFFSANGTHALVFNGEIYNFRELAAKLKREGVVFRTDSDTELLLHWLVRYGPAGLEKLRGMFAFAFWDGNENKLLLARDPYGIKPLYMADDGWTVRVASQVQALRTSPEISDDPEPAGQVGFLLFGHVPEPFTLYQEIRAVPAGHYVEIDDLGPGSPQPFARLADLLSDPEATEIPVAEALRESVRAHLVADVPVGLFLSAGIDSGALLGICRDLGTVPTSLTVAFEEFSGSSSDEAPLAAAVARHYGGNHIIRHVTPEEYEDDLPKIREAMDQPTIDGVNTWFAAKAASEQGLKVALSGLGGDELFGGYPSFREMPRWRRRLGWPSRIPALGALARKLASPLIRKAGISPKAAGLLELGGSWAGLYLLRRGLFMPWELADILPIDTVLGGLERLGWENLVSELLYPDPGSDHDRVLLLESGLYMRNQLLRDADWAGMAHSVEIRTPLVDSHLLRRLASGFELGISKDALARAPSSPLPEAVIDRAKTGFSVPPRARVDRSGLDARSRAGEVSRQVALDLVRAA